MPDKKVNNKLKNNLKQENGNIFEEIQSGVPGSLYHHIYDNLTIGLLMINRDMQVLSANKLMRQWFGEFFKQDRELCFQLFNSPEQEEICADCPVVKTFKDGKIHSIEKTFRIGSEERIFKIVASPVHDKNGKIVAAIEMFEDISGLIQAELSIIENEKKLKSITDSAQDAIVMIGPQGNISFWNPMAERIFGYKQKEVMGKDFHLLLAPKRYHDAFKKVFPMFQRTGTGAAVGRTLELEAVRKDGSEISVELSLSAIELKGEWHAVGIMRDITRRKQIEEKLRESEERKSALITSMDDLVFVLDNELVFQEFHQPLGEDLYRPPEFFVGKHFDEIGLPEPVTERIKTALLRCKKKGEAEKAEYYLDMPQGRKWYDLRVTPLKNRSGDITGLTCVVRNYTDYKNTELALMNNSRMQEMIIRLSTEFVSVSEDNIDEKINDMLQEAGSFFQVDRSYLFVYSEDGIHMSNTHEWCNEGISSEMNNIQTHPLIELPWWSKQIISNKAIHISDISKLPEEAKAEKEEFRRQKIKSLVSVPISANGRIFGFLGFDSVKKKKVWKEDQISFLKVFANILADAFMKVEAEKNLIIAKEIAETANRTKSEFIANISHEIRTPMNSILGFSEVMLNTTKDAKHKNYLKTILDSGKTLLYLINDILDLSKIEAGRMEISPEPTDLRIIIDEMKHIFQYKLREKNVGFVVEIDESFPQTIIIDELRTRQILLNLIGNAVKFTDDGYVKVEVRLESDKNGIINFRIIVSDTGIGFSEKDYDVIFQSFTQKSSVNVKKYGGTGLGLAISKRLCELMNGKITVQSKPGTGSRFTLFFKDIKYSDEIIEQENLYQWDETGVLFQGSKVLVVDDVPHNRKLILKYLEEYNLELYEAEDGESALTAVKDNRPDLVFMDIRMPGINGYEATDIIKKDSQSAHIPIIALTASTMQSEKNKLAKCFDGYLRKPIQKKRLINEMIKHLPHEQIQSEPDLKTGLASIRQEDASVPITGELKTLFLQEFGDQIREQLKKMIIDDLTELAKEMERFARQHKIPQLKTIVLTLHNSLVTFNFDKIQLCLKTLLELFSQDAT